MRYLKYLLLVALVAASVFFLKKEAEDRNVTKDLMKGEEESLKAEDVITSEEKKNKSLEEAQNNSDNQKQEIPREKKLDVPFTSQAPYGVWDIKHDEACEEASIMMVNYFLEGEEITKTQAEKDIQSLVDFQIEEYGDFKDSDADQMVDMAEKFYGISNLEIIYDFGKDDIKKELAKGNPIIIPAAGRILKNPNYSGLGPLYHAIVLTGYDGDNIIANDPGTKRGESYIYDIDTLYDAIHDFTGKKEDILNGRKAMIVVR